MCCESILEELTAFEFSDDDLEGPVYHKDSIASLNEVIQSIGLFLDSMDFQAYKFFFETASQSHVDLIGWKPYEGIYRRVTQEKAKAILKCCCEWGCDWDWQFNDTFIEEQPWAFDMDQIDTMMNNAVKGQPAPFSIKHLIEQAKSSTVEVLPNDSDIQININADFDKNSPTYPPELDAALRAWREVSKKPLPNRGIAVQMEDWVERNIPVFTTTALKRIGQVANWDKQKEREAKKGGKSRKAK